MRLHHKVQFPHLFQIEFADYKGLYFDIDLYSDFFVHLVI